MAKDLQVMADRDNLAEEGKQRLADTRQRLHQAEKKLGAVIKSVDKTPSAFSKAARVVGPWPLWKKVLIGLVTTIPSFIAGFFVTPSMMFALLIASIVIYVSTVFILSEHLERNADLGERLKEGLVNLARAWGTTIVALDAIKEKWLEQVTKASDEKDKLTGNVDTLNENIDGIEGQIETIDTTTENLRLTKRSLEEAAKALESSLEEQSKLVAASQKELAATANDYETNSGLLGQKNEELRALNDEMDIKVAEANCAIELLAQTSTELTRWQAASASQKADHKSKTTLIIESKQAFFDSKMPALMDEVTELAAGAVKWAETTAELAARRNASKSHTTRMEKIASTPRRSPSRLPSQLPALSQHGMWPNPVDYEMTDAPDDQTPTSAPH